MDSFEFKRVLIEAEPDQTVELDLSSDQPDHPGDARPDDALASLSYDEVLELTRMLAPMPGVEGVDIGSGA